MLFFTNLHLHVDAPVVTDTLKRLLIMFSHGAGSNGVYYAWFGEYLRTRLSGRHALSLSSQYLRLDGDVHEEQALANLERCKNQELPPEIRPNNSNGLARAES